MRRAYIHIGPRFHHRADIALWCLTRAPGCLTAVGTRRTGSVYAGQTPRSRVLVRGQTLGQTASFRQTAPETRCQSRVWGLGLVPAYPGPRRSRRRQRPDGHVNRGHGTVIEAFLYARVVHTVAQHPAAEAGLEFLELLLDGVGLLLVAHHVFAVALQEVTDGLHADADGTGGLVLVDVLEAEVGRPGVLDDFFDHRINRRVVAALEAGKLQRDQVGVARHVLGGPDLAAGVFAVAVLPDVVDRQGSGALAGYHFGTEETPDDVVVDGQAVLREHRVTELLELFQDFVVDAGVVVIRAAQQHHADAILALQLFQHLAGVAAHGDVIEVLQGAVAGRHGALVLLGAEAEDILEFLVHLAFEEVRLGEVDEGVQKTYAAFLEHVAFLDERGFDGGRRGGDGGTGARGLHMGERAGEAVDHREEDDVERLFGVGAIEQVVDVRDAQLAGEAGVDGAALGAFLVH